MSKSNEVAIEWIKCAGLRIKRAVPNITIIEICFDNRDDFLRVDDLCGSTKIEAFISLHKDLIARPKVTDNNHDSSIAESVTTGGVGTLLGVPEIKIEMVSEDERCVTPPASPGSQLSYFPKWAWTDFNAAEPISPHHDHETNGISAPEIVGPLTTAHQQQFMQSYEIKSELLVSSPLECESNPKAVFTSVIVRNSSPKLERVQFKCKFQKCSEVFDTSDGMMYHVTGYHVGATKRSFECHLCSKLLPHKQQMQRHIGSVHTGIRPFKCPNRECSKRFTQKGNLKKHIASVHCDIKSFQCPNSECSKSFSLKTNLIRHVGSVHTDLKSCICPFPGCSKSFSMKANLKQHIDWVHSDQKLFQCPIPNCLKKYARKGDLRLHVESVHARRKSFKCPFPMCRRNFSWKRNVLRHIKYNHAQVPILDTNLIQSNPVP